MKNRLGHMSHADLHNAWLLWNKDRNPNSERNKRDLRFGQWLYNNYCHDGNPWPSLFYIEKAAEAYNMAYLHIGDVINSSV